MKKIITLITVVIIIILTFVTVTQFLAVEFQKAETETLKAETQRVNAEATLVREKAISHVLKTQANILKLTAQNNRSIVWFVLIVLTFVVFSQDRKNQARIMKLEKKIRALMKRR